ncbi:MAG: GCN5-related N-acetyltransferase [Frankiales bacterium]|nr:GCN5-related N-acetyltransferase [Frankiales bacterium]
MSLPTLVEWGREDLGRRQDDLLDVYAEAMDVSPAAARARRPIVTAHLDRPGLRAVAATRDDGRLMGVAYGYLGEPGQWWHDQVGAALSRQDASSWLVGAFEVCELHVRPALQGKGLGRSLLDRLLTGPPAPTAVLTTPDRETRARGFYRAAGWVDLVRGLMFPGDPRAFAVLGKQLETPA